MTGTFLLGAMTGQVMCGQDGKRGQSTGTTKGIGAEQERWREPGAEARTWGTKTGVMAGLVMMASGLRGAETGMTLDSWHGCDGRHST